MMSQPVPLRVSADLVATEPTALDSPPAIADAGADLSGLSRFARSLPLLPGGGLVSDAKVRGGDNDGDEVHADGVVEGAEVFAPTPAPLSDSAVTHEPLLPDQPVDLFAADEGPAGASTGGRVPQVLEIGPERPPPINDGGVQLMLSGLTFGGLLAAAYHGGGAKTRSASGGGGVGGVDEEDPDRVAVLGLSSATLEGRTEANAGETVSGWLRGFYAAADQGAGQSSVKLAAQRWNDAQNHFFSLAEDTSADGLANGSNPLSQWIDRVGATDVVSSVDYGEGFVITGQAAAGAAGTIRFYLDNDRTDGLNGLGVQLESGADGVSWTYDNDTGAWSISFAPQSAALLPATHGVWGSGVHQLTVDANGNGIRDVGEASRLFLVAAGTAMAGAFSLDAAGQQVLNGSAAANFSVQDRVTGNVFVYYFGDPDGEHGFALHTQQDRGDTALDTGLVAPGRGGPGVLLGGDWDYYAASGAVAGAASTVENTALGHVTAIAPQVWAFQIAFDPGGAADWETAFDRAGDHGYQQSNSSRLPTLEELLALYAANFVGDAGGNDPNVANGMPGAVQPTTDEVATRTGLSAEDNRPGGWQGVLWSAAPTPSGHALVDLAQGLVRDEVDSSGAFVPVVL